jgi:hypothetical protein
MKLAIIAALLTIAYIIWSDTQKIIARRREADVKSYKLRLETSAFFRSLDNLIEKRKAFDDLTSNLEQSERKQLWSPITDDIQRACNTIRGQNFVEATTYLLVTTQKADNLIAQYQAI